MEVCGIPAPIRFHPLKHHLGWIRSFITAHDSYHVENRRELLARLRTVGRSQMDLYTGPLSLPQIAGEVIYFLEERELLSETAYTAWLQQSEGYQSATLSDGSHWVLRRGQETGRYVHIHPGRYAANTLRVKAGVLKTAIAVRIWLGQTGETTIDLATTNQLRVEWLELPPVKSLEESEGLGRIMQLLA